MSVRVSSSKYPLYRCIDGARVTSFIRACCALAGLAVLMQANFAQAAVVVQEPMSRPVPSRPTLRAPQPPFIKETAVLAESRRLEQSLRGQTGVTVPSDFPHGKCPAGSADESGNSSCARHEASPQRDL